MPPTQECPTISAHKITTSDLNDKCASRIARDILEEALGSKHEWKFDFFTTPVQLEILRRGKLEKFLEWPTSDFPCLSEFLDDIRSGLRESFDTELSDTVESQMANILWRVRGSCIEQTIEVIEIDRMPSEADLVIEGIRDTLGLEGLKQPSRRLARLSRSKLGRWTDPTEKGVVRLAREVMKIAELLEALT